MALKTSKEPYGAPHLAFPSRIDSNVDQPGSTGALRAGTLGRRRSGSARPGGSQAQFIPRDLRRETTNYFSCLISLRESWFESCFSLSNAGSRTSLHALPRVRKLVFSTCSAMPRWLPAANEYHHPCCHFDPFTAEFGAWAWKPSSRGLRGPAPAEPVNTAGRRGLPVPVARLHPGLGQTARL